ncbi:GAF domain-containing protein [Saccharomonospora sp.]|uniref:GAF domain-containing sensor histidine kinase n=1 Tax=Saccharomonospora sp. TaxID=33913 RepID=UPI0026058386|nr:GAF domain-containing protein [Saccharomonospora sp.]
MSSSADAGGRERHAVRFQPAVRERAGFEVDELLTGIRTHLTGILRDGDRLQSLLDAVLAVSGELEPDATLSRVVRAALDLVGARSGALTMFDAEGGPAETVSENLDPTQPSHEVPQSREPDSRTALSVPVRVRGETVGTLYVDSKRDGRELSTDDRVVLRVLAAAAGIAVENARVFERSRVRGRWLEATATLNAELLGGASLDRSLRRIAEIAGELSDADATVVLLDEAGGALSVGAVSGPIRHLDDGTLLSPGPVLADVSRMVEPVVLDDLSEVATSLPSSVAREFGPAVFSPLRNDEGVQGLLVALRRRNATRFIRHEVSLVSSFATQATLALQFADKQESERTVALLADRNRIAQDLHDHVIQRLFAASMSLQGTLRQTNDPHTAERIGDAVRRLDLTVREIRTSIFELHSVGTSEDSLRRRLLDAVPALPRGYPTPSVRIGGAVDTFVPDSLGHDMEFVVREAIRKLARHVQESGATPEIALNVEVGDMATVAVTVGAPASIPPDLPWLEELRRRAHVHGGKVIVDDHDGTAGLLWTVPLPDLDISPP